MSPDDLELPSDPAELRAFTEAMRARLAASEQALEAERAAHDETREKLETAQNSIKLTTLQIEKFKVQLARLRRMKFGQSSERLALQADQLELTLEDLEAEHAHAECVIEGHAPEDYPARAAPRSLAVLRCPTISLATRLCTQRRMPMAAPPVGAQWASSART